ncbi:hypothetical protein O181_078343, partial [Austropuccinia psidii MF-1]|nr:hypothetical protein [Austropuccinia psidii MF-1]
MPSSLAFVKNNLYQELKLSKKVPTIESVLSEVKLYLARDQEVPVPDALVLHIGKRERKNHEKIKKENKEEENDIDNTGHHPRVYCIRDSSGKVNIIREDHAILDSGASHSLFKDSERFVSFTKTCAALQQADGTMIYAKGFGTAAITASDGSIVHLKNSLIVPSITTPLISLSPFLRKGCSLSGKGSKIQLCNENGLTILEGSILNNVITIPLVPLVSNFAKKDINALTIHQSLGHPTNKYASHLFPEVDFSRIRCESCIVAKSHRLPFNGSFPDVSHPLEVLHMDICGPITPPSKGGNRYILQILDGYSHYRYTASISHKSKTFE